MPILITRLKAADSRVLKVDGHLTGQDTESLVRACEGPADRLVLNLADLRSADRRGVSTLRELRERGVVLTGLSPYLTLLLRDTAPRDDTRTEGRT